MGEEKPRRCKCGHTHRARVLRKGFAPNWGQCDDESCMCSTLRPINPRADALLDAAETIPEVGDVLRRMADREAQP